MTFTSCIGNYPRHEHLRGRIPLKLKGGERKFHLMQLMKEDGGKKRKAMRAGINHWEKGTYPSSKKRSGFSSHLVGREETCIRWGDTLGSLHKKRHFPFHGMCRQPQKKEELGGAWLFRGSLKKTTIPTRERGREEQSTSGAARVPRSGVGVPKKNGVFLGRRAGRSSGSRVLRKRDRSVQGKSSCYSCGGQALIYRGKSNECWLGKENILGP